MRLPHNRNTKTFRNLRKVLAFHSVDSDRTLVQHVGLSHIFNKFFPGYPELRVSFLSHMQFSHFFIETTLALEVTLLQKICELSPDFHTYIRSVIWETASITCLLQLVIESPESQAPIGQATTVHNEGFIGGQLRATLAVAI